MEPEAEVDGSGADSGGYGVRGIYGRMGEEGEGRIYGRCGREEAAVLISWKILEIT